MPVKIPAGKRSRGTPPHHRPHPPQTAPSAAACQLRQATRHSTVPSPCCQSAIQPATSWAAQGS
eukprot:12929452-Prorocentrum_lima.AAC.1